MGQKIKKKFQTKKLVKNFFFWYYISGILLSNYDSEYTNQYFHSIYDNSTNNGYDHDKTNQEVVEHLAAVAETVSATIFELFGKKNSGSQPTFDFKGKANK